MNKKRIAVLAATLVMCCVIFLFVGANASDMPFTNLFQEGFAGYTSDEGQFLAHDMVSSKPVSVSTGTTVWFGPCQQGQYFQLVGQDGSGNAVTGKIRGKDLTVADTFGNGTVLYSYTVPAGVSKLVFSVPASLKSVYTVADSEISALTWIAYWDQQGMNTEDFVGKNSYYEVAEGDKLYFGAITKGDAQSSVVYDRSGSPCGTISDLREIGNFGGEYGIYCYTVPAGVCYVQVNYNPDYQQYYSYMKVAADETVTDESVIASFIAEWNIPMPLDSTVAALSGKSALFLGDSITFGARDRANIYGVDSSVNPGAGGWAARIGYFAKMNVTNNGVSGACITTAREQSSSAKHYIYNNLVAAENGKFDYIIMHGLFNDASEKVKVGTMQGEKNFDPAKADVTTYAGALENLFYTAKKQHPESILGFIVNFQTERAVDQAPYVEMAIAICQDWGIPYLDLYHLDGFKVEFDDGLHPSSAGYDSMYTIVANWMATLGKSEATANTNATVMSYNVYFGENVPSDKNGLTIENRYQKVAQKIVADNADIVMLQEYTEAFDKIFKETATGYTVYGDAHGISDEGAPVAWKTTKYDLVKSGNFAASGEWCATATKYPRVINWVILKDKDTGRELLVMSVHGQPHTENEEARNKTMTLVAQKAAEISAENGNVPVVLGGDFNMAVGSVAYNNLIAGGFTDIRATVNPGAGGSYSDWDREQNKFAMGDYLFMSRNVNAQTYAVITNDLDSGREDGKIVHISDHCPIVALITY